jgi:two-component system LytT family response regulator
MRALIVDDEKKARKLLQVLLEENCPEITNIESADNLPNGIKLIHSFQPDIVFLNMEMPGYSGLQMLDFLTPEQVNFEIIFTTAYSEFAIKAFELNAIDYLLKPLRDDQISEAVRKAIGQIGKSSVGERLEELKKSFKATNIRKIGLPVSNGVLFVQFDDIILLKADRMYTKFVTQSDGDVLISKPMKFFIDRLKDAKEFYRPHRSYLINLKHIKQYVNQDGGYIVMDNQQTVGISREMNDEFFEVLQSN